MPLTVTRQERRLSPRWLALPLPRRCLGNKGGTFFGVSTELCCAVYRKARFATLLNPAKGILLYQALETELGGVKVYETACRLPKRRET